MTIDDGDLPKGDEGSLVGTVAGSDRDSGEGELLSRLRVIEDQPLDARAVSYVQLHDELRSRLEGGDSLTSRG